MGIKYRQFQLSQTNPETTMTCWLPSAGLKVGNNIVLEAYPEELWTITKASPIERDIDTIHTDWEVGGIIGDIERSKKLGLKIR